MKYLEKKMTKSKRKRNKYYECKFFRTHREIHPRCAPQNVKRWKWIDNNGKGRTYNEINKADSVYRQCIRRRTYAGNMSSIDQDLRYDIHVRMIEIR